MSIEELRNKFNSALEEAPPKKNTNRWFFVFLALITSILGYQIYIKHINVVTENIPKYKNTEFENTEEDNDPLFQKF